MPFGAPVVPLGERAVAVAAHGDKTPSGGIQTGEQGDNRVGALLPAAAAIRPAGLRRGAFPLPRSRRRADRRARRRRDGAAGERDQGDQGVRSE